MERQGKGWTGKEGDRLCPPLATTLAGAKDLKRYEAAAGGGGHGKLKVSMYSNE